MSIQISCTPVGPMIIKCKIDFKFTGKWCKLPRNFYFGTKQKHILGLEYADCLLYHHQLTVCHHRYRIPFPVSMMPLIYCMNSYTLGTMCTMLKQFAVIAVMELFNRETGMHSYPLIQ